MQTEKTSTKKIALNYGLILGLTLALTTTMMYALNTELFTKWWIGILTILIVIGFGIVSTAKCKSELDGIITFKEAFSAYFITVAVGLMISTLVGILIFIVLDPALAQSLQERTLEISREMMESFGTPEADINRELTKLSQQNTFSAINQLKSYVFLLAFQTVIGLMIGLIMRQKPTYETR